MAKHILLTGASGFLGRHLLPHLLARGFCVTVATRQSSGRSIEGLRNVVVGDLRGKIDWPKHLVGVDGVIHLAALAHITAAIPEADYDTVNRKASVDLAQAAIHAGAKFVFISSVAAQSGPSSELPLTEELTPQPTTTYGRSKLRAELEIAALSDNFVVFRPTLVYGAGVIGNMQRLVGLALSRVPPPFGLIHNRRSLLAVQNFCDAVVFALQNETMRGHTFLLADEEPISTADIVTQLRLGAGLKPTMLPVPPQVLFSLLRVLGRDDVREKVAGNLIASVKKLRTFGFRWSTTSQHGLYALGAINRSFKSEKSQLSQSVAGSQN